MYLPHYVHRLSSNKSISDTSALQHKIQKDIDNLVQWSVDSGMSFNISKCFSVSFGHSNFHRSYTICNTTIPRKDSFSDLGVVVTLPYSFKSHVDMIVSRAFSKLGIINKIFKTRSKKAILQLYKAFVRPSVDYASIIWSPYTESSIYNIERIQRRLCRLIPGLGNMAYRDQLDSLGLMSLRARRLRFQLITLFKLYKGYLNLDFYSFFDVRDSRTTRGHSCHITPKFSKRNYRLHFFTVSTISFWNQLTQEDIDVNSVTSFKMRLELFFTAHDIW